MKKQLHRKTGTECKYRVRKEAEFVHDLVDLIENVASTRKE